MKKRVFTMIEIFLIEVNVETANHNILLTRESRDSF